MSLFGSLMGDLDEDPIFRSHMRSMRQMNSMMNSIFSDPFGMMNPSFMGRNAITNSSNHPAIGHPSNGMLQMMPFGFPAMPGLNMEGLFSNFDNMAQGGNCHSFTSSSVMTMASGPDGRPQVYQETMSTTTAPGGVKETKKTVCDSRTGTKKMAIGHHIGDRAHILEREQNIRSGEEEEHEEFINLDEEEAESFNHEWKSRTQRAMGTGNAAICGRNYGAHGNNHNRSRADHRQLALPEPPAPSRQTKRLKWAPSPRPSIRSASPLIHGSSTTRSEALPSSTAKKVSSSPSSSSTTVSTGSRKREHTPDTSGGNKRHSTVDNSDST